MFKVIPHPHVETSVLIVDSDGKYAGQGSYRDGRGSVLMHGWILSEAEQAEMLTAVAQELNCPAQHLTFLEKNYDRNPAPSPAANGRSIRKQREAAASGPGRSIRS